MDSKASTKGQNDLKCEGRTEGINCKKNATYECDFCKRHFCDYHLRPKLVGSRNYISNLTDQDLIERYKIEDGDDGHPDPQYYEQWMTEYRKEKEKRAKQYNESLTALIKGSIEEEHEIISASGICAGDGLGHYDRENRPVHFCRKCKKTFCAYHAYRKQERWKPGLGGHVCK